MGAGVADRKQPRVAVAFPDIDDEDVSRRAALACRDRGLEKADDRYVTHIVHGHLLDPCRRERLGEQGPNPLLARRRRAGLRAYAQLEIVAERLLQSGGIASLDARRDR